MDQEGLMGKFDISRGKNCDLYQYFLLDLFGNIFGHLSPVEQGLNSKMCGRENRFSFRYSHPGHYHFL